MSNAHRSTVVEGDHFEIAPAISGFPLASRYRRFMAMLVDLAIIAAPSVAIRNPIAPVAALLAAVFYRYSSSWSSTHWKSDAGLASRRAISLGIVAVGLVAGQIWRWNERKHEISKKSLENNPAALAKVDAAIASLQDIEAMPPEARQNLKTAREALADVQSASSAAATGASAGEPEEVRRLRSQNLALVQQVDSMQQELKEARKDRGILHFLEVSAHDFGIGLGWSGLYFIVFPVLWNGRTPGKRLMQIRIARLNGKPISWWNAFERFHGYVSCLLGGLIGFLQVLWDPQNQGHHDKIAETVVVKDLPIAMALPVASPEASRASQGS